MLKNYLPDFLQDVKEFDAITSIEQVELDKISLLLKEVLDNQFVETANEKGISLWEKMMGTAPKDTDTIEERRFRLAVKLAKQGPYTEVSLRKQLEIICGTNGFDLEIIPSLFTVNIKLELTAKSEFNDVKELLELMVPANMVINLSLRYNIWDSFKNQNWNEVANVTWTNMREEVIK